MATGSPVPPLQIEIRPSKMLAGQIGLFAARPIKKDSVIAEAKRLGEHFIPWKSFSKIDKITQAKLRQYCLQTEKGFFAPQDLNYLTVPWNMNHSCAYNVGFDDQGNFVTARSVRRGEELCWDYGMGISDPNFKLKCACKGSKCRGVVTGSDWKDKEYMRKNKKYFMRELLQAANQSIYEK